MMNCSFMRRVHLLSSHQTMIVLRLTLLATFTSFLGGNQAIAQFGPQQLLSVSEGSIFGDAADLDGDGDLDVLANQGWYENLGNGVFGPIILAFTDPVFHAGYGRAMDLDGDQDLDVVHGGGTLTWRENLGGGAFGPLQVIDSGPTAFVVLEADLDQDLDPDILVYDYLGDKIFWYENLGAGTFGPQQLITIQEIFPRAIAVDFDGDADLDLLTSSYDTNTVAWYENLGTGTFGPRQVVSAQIVAPTSIGALDMDGDGDLDFVAISGQLPVNGPTLVWFENLGGASFGPQQVLFTGGGGNAIELLCEDLDGDGDKDVIIGFYLSGHLLWFENISGGALGPAQTLTTLAFGLTELVAADFDGDGDPDVLSTGHGAGPHVAWYENLHEIGTSYCIGAANSTGSPAAISATGNTSVVANDLLLRAEPLPDQPGVFFYGSGQASVPFGNGSLCIAGQIARLDVVNAVGNVMTYLVDNTSPPSAATQITAGSTWNFQAWFRDPAAGGAFFNLSDGLAVTFSP